MSETPREQQCTMPSCSEPVADGRAAAGLCQSHIDGLGDDIEDDDTPKEREHENPIDRSDVTDEERAQMLLDYLDRIREEFGTTPLLMPLDEEGKAPWITGRCSLDSAKARQQLVDGYEGRPDSMLRSVAFSTLDCVVGMLGSSRAGSASVAPARSFVPDSAPLM